MPRRARRCHAVAAVSCRAALCGDGYWRTGAQQVREIMDASQDMLGKEVIVKGWCRTVRDQKAFSFIELNDGSLPKGIQVTRCAAAPASLPACLAARLPRCPPASLPACLAARLPRCPPWVAMLQTCSAARAKLKQTGGGRLWPRAPWRPTPR
jgi:hypothetical protein